MRCAAIVALGAIIVNLPTAAVAQESNGPRRALPFPNYFGAAKALRESKGSGAPPAESAGARAIPPVLRSIMTTCGDTDDWQDVEFYSGAKPTRAFVLNREPAVAQLQWHNDLKAALAARNLLPGNIPDGMRWCTGTMISPNMVLTAGHCVQPTNNDEVTTPHRKPDAQGKFELLTADENALLLHLNFRYQRDGNDGKDPKRARIRSADIYPVLRLVEYGFQDKAKKKLDYAILEIGKGADGELPDAKYAVTEFDASDSALGDAKLLTMIQHPQGLPKVIMAGPKQEELGDLLLYNDLDTQGGSSGSGVLAESGKLIAVHIAGGCTKVGGANRAVTLKAIRQVSQIIK